MGKKKEDKPIKEKVEKKAKKERSNLIINNRN
jgi:hypothetical protein